MERLDENEREYFVTWSEHFGYDITTDDPHMMVAHYQDIYGASIVETEEELADISGNFCDMLPLQYEIFDDTYN